MTNLVNRDFADKRFLRTASRSLTRGAGGAREQVSRAVLLAALLLYGFALASSGMGHQSVGMVADPSARVDRG